MGSECSKATVCRGPKGCLTWELGGPALPFNALKKEPS